MKLLYILLLPVFIFAHGGEKHDTKKQTQQVALKETTADKYSKINEEYLKNIKPIFEVKCFDCHSDKTKKYWYSDLPLVSLLIKSDIEEAKEHLDFSKDFPFVSHDTPKKDLISILEVFEEKEMPPFRYIIMHSESVVSDEDINKVKMWVENSLELLNKKD